MAFCSKCGTELTEGAKFCPKCGESVQSTEEKPKSIVEAFKEGWQEGAKESQNNPSENESLSTWEKIALGVAGFVAFTGICGGVADGMWIAVLVSLCAMGAICAVFMGTIEKKYAWTTAIASFFIVCVAIGASASDEKEEIQEQAQTEQKQESPAEKQAREKREKEERRNDNIKRIKRKAAEEGRILAQSVRYTESWPKHCQNSYISAFGTPSTDEDYKMFDVFKEEFRKSYFATLDAQQKMN
jgi:uncharacterized Zn finger protein (UPF0148 family)